MYKRQDQLRKFCRCTQGIYGYTSYSYVFGRKRAYRYADAGNNGNWEAEPVMAHFPAYRVKCTDGKWYYTNQDYYR